MHYSVLFLVLVGIIAPSLANSELKRSEDGDGVDLYIDGQKVEPDESCVKGAEKFNDEYKWKCYTHCLYLGFGRGWCLKEGESEKETCKCEESANYAKKSYQAKHAGKGQHGGAAEDVQAGGAVDAQAGGAEGAQADRAEDVQAGGAVDTPADAKEQQEDADDAGVAKEGSENADDEAVNAEEEDSEVSDDDTEDDDTEDEDVNRAQEDEDRDA